MRLNHRYTQMDTDCSERHGSDATICVNQCASVVPGFDFTSVISESSVVDFE